MRKILLLATVLAFLSVTYIFAEEFNLIHYYPTPYIAYRRLLFTPLPTAAAPIRNPPPCDGSTVGSMYVEDSVDGLRYCKSDGAGGGDLILYAPDVIWELKGTNYVVLKLVPFATDYSKVGFGIGDYDSATNYPSAKLTMKEDAGILAIGTLGSGSLNQSFIDLNITFFSWRPKNADLHVGSSFRGNAGLYSVSFGSHSFSAIAPFNPAVFNYSAVLGGRDNGANSDYSVIAGGELNRAYGIYNTLGGGYGNISGGNATDIRTHAFIGGGLNNKASGWTLLAEDHSVVFGGKGNIAIGDLNVILGGEDNTNRGSGRNFLGGGYGNYISSNANTIFGGSTNSIGETNSSNYYSTIGGGASNLIGEYSWSTILGGSDNNVFSDYSFIAGGKGNVNSMGSFYDTIIGGLKNTSNGGYGTVLGGYGNYESSEKGFIGGGRNNKITRDIVHPYYGTIIGGKDNLITVNGSYGFIGAGESNKIGGKFATITGGAFNKANSNYSWAGGRHMVSAASAVFAWGYSQDTDVTVSASETFYIHDSHRVGFGTTAPTPGYALDIEGSVRIQGPNNTLKLTSIPTSGSHSKQLYHKSTDYWLYANDIAETFETSEEVEVGDLLTIDEKLDLKLKKSYQAFDKNIIGIVSGSPALFLEGSQASLSTKPLLFEKGIKPPVAIAGRVPCKVSLENGPIEHGDLLTSSSLPGHAMRAEDWERSFDAVVGKALQPFHGGPNGEQTGIIMVLVTLQ